MVKLNGWGEVNKTLFRRHMPKVVSANEMLVFRKIEQVFSGKDDGEAHQCFCGNLFYLGSEIKKKAPKDWLGNPLCPKCGKAPESYEDSEWRRKFNKFVKITEALDHFEKSDPPERVNALKEIKTLANGLFKFSTTDEMYVGYYKLMTELKADAKDFTPSLNDKWRALIDELFEEAKYENLEEFINFIFSSDALQIRQIEDTINDFRRSIARMEKDYFLSKVSDYPIFVSPLTIENIEESRIRSSLLLYSHLIELDALFDLTMNLIRVSKGKKIEKKPIPKSIKYPKDKIPLIVKENPQIGALFEEFWVSQVRNALAHSKYKIEKGFFIKTDENFKIPLTVLQTKIDLCSNYWRYLSSKIAKEVAFALEKKVFHTKDGITIVISGQTLPPEL